MKKILIIALTVIGYHAAMGKPYERTDGLAKDSERYADLLSDPYSARFLDIFLDPSYNHNSGSIRRPTEEEMAIGRWFREQGEKSFPILLEVIRREQGNLGADRIYNALNWIGDHRGDKTAILTEVRGRLPHWKDSGFNHNMYSRLVSASFRLLAAEGDESDLALMQSLLDPERGKYQDEIDEYSRELMTRLEREKARPDKRYGLDAISPSVEGNAGKAAVNGANGQGKVVNAPSKILWTLLVLILALPLFVLAIRNTKR